MRFRLPHPFLLIAGCVALAAVATWILPPGEFDRREDAGTGRTVVVAGTFHPVPAAPVGPFGALVAIPRGFVEAAEIVAAILFVGGAWVVLDRTGTLNRLVASFVARLGGNRIAAMVLVSLFFLVMGAISNMQEEIIALVPMLLVLGRRIQLRPVAIVAISAGAAMAGSAFGPTNPFQAGIALKLAELPPLSGAGIRAAMLAVGFVVWVGWTIRKATGGRTGVPAERAEAERAGAPGADTSPPPPATWRDALAFAVMLAPLAAYVYGGLAWGWTFNDMSGGFLASGMIAGLIVGLSMARTLDFYWAGMQALLPAAVLVGAARSISLVLADGHVIDTILHGLSRPLASVPANAAALMMVPFHILVHVPVSSVSGQAVLTMPVLVPLSDLLGISRQVTVVAYQTGAGLTEFLTPTNGSLMAILMAAGVPFGEWLRFALGGVALLMIVGLAGMFWF